MFHRVKVLQTEQFTFHQAKEIFNDGIATYSGTMDSSLFEFWFEKQVLPVLPSDAVIAMDNAAFHRKAQLIRAAKS